jgi:glycosyltransferase involved in cell wall biosynthesis
MRDNRVAATLIAKGRDVVLIPLYTPLRTDEPDASEGRVYYGGINIYLQQKSALFRRLPGWLSRVLDARPLLRRTMRLAGDVDPADLGTLTVSVMRGENGAQRRELDELIRGLREIKPDLVSLPNLMFVGLAGALKSALGVPVLCTLSGEDVFLDNLPDPFRQQALDLIHERSRDVDGFIAVTDYYAGRAAERFGLKRDRIHVVPMGVRTDDVGEPVGPPPEPFTIGYLARVCPEKGLANLCEVFVQLRRGGRDCRLLAAGYLAPTDRSYLDRVCAALRDAGAIGEFEYVGEVDRAAKLSFLRSLHVLSVPTDYPEPKGLYLLEAMACGVPVVQPHKGSFPEIVGATGGGLLYDPTSPDALAGALTRLMDDAELRERLGDRGRLAVRRSFNDEVMADRTWELFEGFLGNGAA